MIWEYDQLPDTPGVTTRVRGSVYGDPRIRAVLTSAANLLAHTTDEYTAAEDAWYMLSRENRENIGVYVYTPRRGQ